MLALPLLTRIHLLALPLLTRNPSLPGELQPLNGHRETCFIVPEVICFGRRESGCNIRMYKLGFFSEASEDFCACFTFAY